MFSVITVCFNAEKTIASTIASVLAQDYPNLEYIIIDGLSTDQTLNIINQHNAGGKIRLISEKDEGLYDAINKGISLCTGEFTGILHADDVFADTGVLSRIVAEFEKDTSAEAVSASVSIFKENDRKRPYRIYKSTSFRNWQFRIGMQPPHPGFFIRKAALDKVGYYRTQFKISGDFDWLLRAIYLCKIHVVYTDYIAVHMSDGGISSSGWKSKKLMNNENLRILKLHGIYSNKFLVYLKYLWKIFQIRKIF